MTAAFQIKEVAITVFAFRCFLWYKSPTPPSFASHPVRQFAPPHPARRFAPPQPVRRFAPPLMNSSLKDAFLNMICISLWTATRL
jgi:hypothetical protein